MKQELSEFEKHVIFQKGTEPPFTGKYYNFFDKGIYICRVCETPLYDSNAKFTSHCGWASFDSEINQNVKRIPSIIINKLNITKYLVGIKPS